MRRATLAGSATSLNVSVNTTISPPSRGILVNGSASVVNVNVTMAEDGTVIVLPLVTGVIHPIEASHVWASGTTATTAIYFR